MSSRGNFSIREIDHLVLTVTDIEASLYFYCELLGCELVRKIDSPEIYQLRAGISLIDLRVVNKREITTENMDHFCLAIEPFHKDELIGFCREHQVPYDQVAIRFGAKGYGESLYIKDPEGNTVELKSTTPINQGDGS